MLLLSFVVGPLVALLRRWHLPRVLAVGSAVLFTLAIVAALATLIGVQVASLAGDVPRHRSTIELKIEGLRGLGTRVAPFGDVARAKIDGFGPGALRIICIVSLPISGEPAHLRRLVERLRRRMPDVPVVVGLWQADDEAAGRDAIPAAGHVSSLRSAVETVLNGVAADADTRGAAAATGT